MEYNKFLEKIINGGIKGVKKDYKRENQKLLKEGSIAGFEKCREKNPLELGWLLERSQEKSNEKMQEKDYWYYRGFASEVEWVCNVISAVLMNQKKPVIINPTARGVFRAVEIMGVKKAHD